MILFLLLSQHKILTFLKKKLSKIILIECSFYILKCLLYFYCLNNVIDKEDLPVFPQLQLNLEVRLLLGHLGILSLQDLHHAHLVQVDPTKYTNTVSLINIFLIETNFHHLGKIDGLQ